MKKQSKFCKSLKFKIAQHIDNKWIRIQIILISQ